MLCAVKLRVLGLMAYWYTGSAFYQVPQSYLLPQVQYGRMYEGCGQETNTARDKAGAVFVFFFFLRVAQA